MSCNVNGFDIWHGSLKVSDAHNDCLVALLFGGIHTWAGGERRVLTNSIIQALCDTKPEEREPEEGRVAASARCYLQQSLGTIFWTFWWPAGRESQPPQTTT